MLYSIPLYSLCIYPIDNCNVCQARIQHASHPCFASRADVCFTHEGRFDVDVKSVLAFLSVGPAHLTLERTCII